MLGAPLVYLHALGFYGVYAGYIRVPFVGPILRGHETTLKASRRQATCTTSHECVNEYACVYCLYYVYIHIHVYIYIQTMIQTYFA